MRYEIVKDFPNDILYEKDKVCISIYQPVSAQRQKARIIFKNQIQKVKNSLDQKFKRREVEDILKPLYEIEQDLTFWNKAKDGIAVLMNCSSCIIYNLFRDVKELTMVSDSFHIKPLLRVYQSADKYYVLGVNRKTFNLYYGDRYEFRKLEFSDDIPITIEDVLGDDYYTDLGRGQTRGKDSSIYSFGQGGKQKEIEKNTEKYLRHVDRFVFDNYSKPTKSPLVLATLNEYQGVFRKLSHNSYLLEDGISKNFESMSNSDIKKESWKIVEKIYLEKTKELVDRFEEEKTKSNASDKIEDIAIAAVENRIDTVLIESDKIIPGTINLTDGTINKDKVANIETGDILDKIAELAFAGGGEVVMLPSERMPTNTGVAAVYRY